MLFRSTDLFGFPVADIPRPVRIKTGVDPSQWTPKQIEDARLRSLGPRFFPGTQPPPQGDTIYWPSPNDVTRYDEATGQWVDKRPYTEI